jgi:SAM-dependent methyltransferase
VILGGSRVCPELVDPGLGGHTHHEPQVAAYDCWADYYDVTDADRTPFINFYRSLVTERRPRSLLDLGCGTGTVTIALAQHLVGRHAGSPGARVVGVDVSSGMLDVARERDARVEWVQGDMRSPPVDGSFDLVICTFNTLQSLLRDDDLAQAFGSVRRLLSADGAFAFDIYQPNLDYISIAQTDRLARSVTDGHGRRLEIREDTRYDPRTRVLTIDWRLVEELNTDAPPLARMRCPVRQYFPADVARSLDAAGLAVQERYGDLDRSPFTPDSKKQVLVCGPA